MRLRYRGFGAVAALAVGLQALVSVLTLAWVSRRVEPAQVGAYGFGLTAINLALALDGIRQVVVVQTVRDGGMSADVRHSAALALLIAFVVGWVAIVVAWTLGGLAPVDRWALGVAVFAVLSVGPSLGFLEGSRGPASSLLLHALSWSVGIALTSMLVVKGYGQGGALWGLLSPPAISAVVLARSGHWVRPAWSPRSPATGLALNAVMSNVATAVSGSLDRLLLWGMGSPAALGRYVPLAELVGRGHALSGLLSGVFLRSESTAVAGLEAAQPASEGQQLANGLFIIVALCALGGAMLAADVCRIYLGYADDGAVLAFRILLVTLCTGLGAQWTAMRLRARGYFAFHWMYAASGGLALMVSPLVMVGRWIDGAIIFALVRSADLLVLWTGRALVTKVQWASMAFAAAGVILLIAFGNGVD